MKQLAPEAEHVALIVGAGQSGLAVAASLAVLSVPYLLLERDDCIAFLWRKRTYNCLRLHVHKNFSQLPHYPHSPSTPAYISKDTYLDYLDDYTRKFNIRVLFRREVRSVVFDRGRGKWMVEAANIETGEVEEYRARYVVVASGENDGPGLPTDIPGMGSFCGKVMHSSEYRSGKEFEGKDVLVVGGGNSGMEISLDLLNFGAHTSIVVRSPIHLITKEMCLLAFILLKIFSVRVVDAVILFLCKMKYGDTTKYGIRRPTEGPFYLKATTNFYAVIDLGTFQKIKTGEIKVLPSITSITGNTAIFSNGKSYHFDAIILATGYKSLIKNWLKSDNYLIDDNGMIKQKFPNHWKGKNGLYCAGLARRGILGSYEDALSIASDISKNLKC